MRLETLVAELRRRRVFRALVTYGIVAFAILQVIEPIVHGLRWPDATVGYVVVGLGLGFPLVAVLAWAFDLRTTGLERTAPGARGPRGAWLALVLVGLGLLAAAPGVAWLLLKSGDGDAGVTPAAAKDASSSSADTGVRWRVPLDAARSRGPAEAPVTIVEFGDFQCPYSRRVEPLLRKLEERYPGKLRILWRDYPLEVHPLADAAAQVAHEALRQQGPAGFWRAHDELLAAPVSEVELERVARGMSLDVEQVRTTLRTERHRAAIDADVQTMARLGPRGTPLFFVNGRRVDMEDQLEAVVAEALVEARQLMASGVAPGRLYEVLQKSARAEGDPPARITLPPSGRRPSRGSKSPRAVEVHEFCDLSLARCSWIEPGLRKTLERYGDEVRLVWWDISDLQRPESRRVRRAVLAAAGGDPGRFWAMHDAILANLSPGIPEPARPDQLTLAALREKASAAGADLGVFDYEMAQDEWAPLEDVEVEEARALGLRAGSVVVDGKVLGAAEPSWILRAAIDEALARPR
jgi:protein-disulfide isomerase